MTNDGRGMGGGNYVRRRAPSVPRSIPSSRARRDEPEKLETETARVNSTTRRLRVSTSRIARHRPNVVASHHLVPGVRRARDATRDASPPPRVHRDHTAGDARAQKKRTPTAPRLALLVVIAPRRPSRARLDLSDATTRTDALIRSSGFFWSVCVCYIGCLCTRIRVWGGVRIERSVVCHRSYTG